MTFAEYGFTLEDYVTKELKLDLERGGRYCCCPLHDENTASFRIYDNEDTFYCFGCDRGGDVVVLHRLLAKRAGREIRYGEALGEVRKIVYKHTKNPKVLEGGEQHKRSNYVVDGKRVIARTVAREESTETSEAVLAPISSRIPKQEEVKASTEVADAAVVEETKPATAIKQQQPKRSPLETLRIVQETKRSIWNRDLGQAQRLLFQLENP